MRKPSPHRFRWPAPYTSPVSKKCFISGAGHFVTLRIVLSEPVIRALWSQLDDSDPIGHPGQGWVAPSGVHEEFIFNDTAETYLVCGGDRGAKTTTTAMKAYLLALEFISTYPLDAGGHVAWVVADNYNLTATEMRDCIGEWLMQMPEIAQTRGKEGGFKQTARIDPGTIEIPTPNGKTFKIETKSVGDPMNAMRAEGPVWILACEAALLSHDFYLRAQGRLGQIRGQSNGKFGQLIMSGTLEGSLGWYPTQYTKWKSETEATLDKAAVYSFRSQDNPFAWPGGAENAQLKQLERELPEALFMERYLAVPSPPSGRVHDRFDSTIHVKEVEYDPALPVYLGMDPGYSGASSNYAIVVAQKKNIQRADGRSFQQWHIIDQIYEHHMTVDEICQKAMDQYWWKNPKKIGVIDIAGSYHAGAQESNTEVWQKKTGLTLMHERVNIQPGIDRFNTMLQYDPEFREPKVLFHPRCTGILSELGHCLSPVDNRPHIYSWNKNRMGDVIGKVPKDDFCDGIKALTYLWINQVGYATANQGPKRPHVRNIRGRRRAALTRY